MLLDIKNLNYKVGNKQILNNINVGFNYGLYGLLGLSGAGKSSLLNTIATLIAPTSGTITYNGNSIFSKPATFLKDLGFMSQNIGLIQDFTIEHNLYYFGLMKGCTPKYLKTKIPQLLDMFNLSSFKKIKTANLSGGLRQRVGIALALINEPKVLILDEPINNLDNFEREKLYDILKIISKHSIVIISTHLINEISKNCDELIFMRNGGISLQFPAINFSNNAQTIESLFTTYAY